MEIQERGIENVDISSEMREAYLQYSMSVIVGRALPDVRDGLKPVHRRVLFAMHELSNTYDKPYKKSARVVGDVIGKYHPHGDTAAYDTIVRMAQDFSLRYPLVDGQGNFGSIDGDNAAASRYTEVRMTKLAGELLQDLEKDTVEFGLNYDDSLKMPKVLPAKVPNLLINGSSGIAVGMATNIPPHNLTEVIDGCIHLIENPDCEIAELLKLIPGPDFPTAGLVSGRQGILSAYIKGRGVITLKAVAEIETNKDREDIVVTELPYQVNKRRLIESIAELVKEKKIEGISDLRDESSREGMRIVISVKKNENAGVLLNRLFKYTQLQVAFGIIMLALDSKGQPKIFNLKECLQSFINHRKDVVTKRCVYDLKKAEQRAHILEGFKKALDIIDQVIETIRRSSETLMAKQNLMNEFGFSEEQSKAILEMRLQRLTGLERQKILDELSEIKKQIEWLRSVLADVKEVYKIIVTELEEIRQRYGDPRKTKIIGDENEIEDEDLITEEDMVVTITHTGYIKRISTDQYRAQKRGGKGIKALEVKEEDVVSALFAATTKTTLLFFTDKGKLHQTKVYKLPLGVRTSRGKAVANVLQLSPGEGIRAVLPVDTFDQNRFVVMVTKMGIIKKVALTDFSRPKPGGLIALTTNLSDEVISAQLTNGEDDIFIATKEGMSIRISEEHVREMGRVARGNRAIRLSKGDEVIGMQVIPKEKQNEIEILMVTNKGYGKRTLASEYRRQGRGGIGLITHKSTERVGHAVKTLVVDDSKDLMIITDKGKTIRIRCAEVSTMGRNTQGVRLINLNEGETVTSIALVESEPDQDAPESVE